MKHEKPPSPPPAAFPPPAPSSPSPPGRLVSTYFTALLSPPLSNTIRERVPASPFLSPQVPTSNFECITGPPLTLSIPSSLRSDGDITITGT